ncbi:hypothetical protein [Arthrobacter sp. H35-D1]|uniref:hypothetical protein n=1 Tax=Arthrobacter sp. H35-D1 TaxID=3046202 RepID=UPI0024BB7E0E|nr:hypothetical protein [Arthrobacter sp. H35-D1]MDJ0311767.1 hypothetical protein [Arthrobacter sp. H35-D1]
MGQDKGEARNARLDAQELSAEELEALRPYVVELQNGKFATTAELNTTEADVDAIFSTHLPEFARSRGPGPVPVVFWAHGGLVGERSALAYAQHNIPWWLANGIYPIHFVWHSGLWATLGDLLADHLGELAGPASDTAALAETVAPLSAATDFTDGLIEDLLRSVGGPEVWAAMKDNAHRASEAGGGASYVAEALRAYLEVEPATIHAAGFSAGTVFQRYFIPEVVHGGGAAFNTCSLLVPSLCTESFKEGLAPLLGTGIKSLTLFGMQEELALADNVFGLYRKSLLYLIQAALNPTPGTPILGLQESVFEDPALASLFKTAPAAGIADAVWSVATSGPLDSRSTATTHTAFDDDAHTMDSVVRRITGRENIVSYGTTRHARVLAFVAGSARSRP